VTTKGQHPHNGTHQNTTHRSFFVYLNAPRPINEKRTTSLTRNRVCSSRRYARERTGPIRVTQAGIFTSRTVHAAGVGCFVLAGIAMLPAIAHRGGAVQVGCTSGLYKFNPVDPWLESARFQPLIL
jgi:hypothetical protein